MYECVCAVIGVIVCEKIVGETIVGYRMNKIGILWINYVSEFLLKK